jgi:hypothetical protein
LENFDWFMEMLISIFEWLVSVADSIIHAVLSFFIIILMLFTFTMASLFEDENGQHLYCETSDTGIESCEMREWSLVT